MHDIVKYVPYGTATRARPRQRDRHLLTFAAGQKRMFESHFGKAKDLIAWSGR
jgi:hypothetical protein